MVQFNDCLITLAFVFRAINNYLRFLLFFVLLCFDVINTFLLENLNFKGDYVSFMVHLRFFERLKTEA